MTDPLSFEIPTAGIDTSIPLLPDGNYPLQITASNFGVSNFDKETPVWSPEVRTTQPATSVDGKEIPVNTRLFLQYDVDLAERKDPKFPGAWIKNLCRVVDAIFGTDQNNRPNVNKALLDSAVGKVVECHVVIDTDKQGTSRNKVTRFIKPVA